MHGGGGESKVKGWGWGMSANFNNTSRGGSTEKMTLEQSLAGEEVSHGAEAMVGKREQPKETGHVFEELSWRLQSSGK